MNVAIGTGLALVAIIGACLFVLWYGSAVLIDQLEDRIEVLERNWAEQFGPPVEDSPAAELLAEPHLGGLTGSSEDLADLLPRRPASLGVPGLSGDFLTECGVEDLQSVQGVQLARDVTEVVGQPVEDRGAEFVTDRLVVPVGDHEVAEDVTQPAESLPGAVVTGGVVVDGESGDRHAVKGGLTTGTCQGELDTKPDEMPTDEFPVAPETVPDGMPLAVHTALIDQRPSPVPRDLSDEFPHPVDSDERKAKNAADIDERLKRFDFSGRNR